MNEWADGGRTSLSHSMGGKSLEARQDRAGFARISKDILQFYQLYSSQSCKRAPVDPVSDNRERVLEATHSFPLKYNYSLAHDC